VKPSRTKTAAGPTAPAKARKLTRAIAAVALLSAGCAGNRPVARPEASAACRCTPQQPCWPAAGEWQRFGAGLHGKLEQPESPFAACRGDAAGQACKAAIQSAKNPFALQDHSGGTQSTGWLDAWSSAPSAYAVVAEDAADIAAAVDFARERRLRLVIKGTGHDYLGRSSAPDSLLVWTHRMRRVSMHDAFAPRGCQATQTVGPAVTVEAGTRWLEAYQEVTVRQGRYVQGGGCTSVGAAGGFMQGGGFGSWSKKYGIAAASMLEAEVVTADGKLRVANACQNQDLFWALRGGGGGTFGIVTRVTLQTHPLPDFFGAVDGSIVANSDGAFAELIERFLVFYRERLSNEHWGEQVRVRGGNSLDISLVFQGMRAAEAEQVWRPFRAWLEENPTAYTVKLQMIEIPGRRLWDAAFLKEHAPEVIRRDERAESPADRFWWAGDGDQVSTYWYAYQSRWVPLELFESGKVKTLATALFQASRHWSIGLHFNKAQAGADDEAVRRGKQTAMNPAVYSAATLILVAASGSGHPGVAGHEPDRAKGEAAKAGVTAAMKFIRDVTPSSGSYVNEADYFEPDWQRSFWGENYPRLLEIKRKYDPDGLFYCHHCVGSEGWSNDGMCRSAP
jgi:FAD/FMN-containing dehydrogenase